MTLKEEQELGELCQKLADLTKNPPFEAMRYDAIGRKVTEIVAYVRPELSDKEKHLLNHAQDVLDEVRDPTDANTATDLAALVKRTLR